MKVDRNIFWYVKKGLSIEEFYDLVSNDEMVCDLCGCPEVEEKVIEWRRVNGGAFCGDNECDCYYWCPHCGDDNVSIIEFEDWKEENEEKFFKRGK